MSDQLLIAPELGPEFDLGTVQTDRVRLKIGTGLANLPDGTVTSPPQTLNVTKLPLYQTKDLWAEESGGLGVGNEWSWGNGDTGTIGAVVDTGWEIIGLWFDADNGGSAAESITIGLTNFSTGANTVLASMTVTAAGLGQDNNAFDYLDLSASPVAVPDFAKVGFRTVAVTGTWNSGRVGALLRKQVGEYVSDVTIS